MGMENHSWLLDASYDEWVAVPVSGPRPAARYKVLVVFMYHPGICPCSNV